VTDPRYGIIENKLSELADAARNGSVRVVEDIPTTAIAAAAGTDASAPGLSVPGRAVKDVLRDILGWTWRPNDTQGFLTALKSSYVFEEVAGARHAQYKPSATAFRGELGTVSGAQSIILQEVRAAADRIIPELEVIPPLRIAPDPQRVTALRAICVADVRELAQAFTKIDGPTIQRVDGLWKALVGDPEDLDPENPDPLAHLGEMKNVFGFDRSLVNTVEQELILSRWLAIVTELTSLRQVYAFQRDYFIPGSGKEPYWGTSLVIISQWLQVIADSVREFEAALATHFIEESEQERIELRLDDDSRIFLGAMLAWAERFPVESQEILKSAGKEGARSLLGPLQELAAAVQAARPEVVGAPYLYNNSPIVRSTQAVLEASILRTWEALLPFDQPGEGTYEGAEGGSGEPSPPWIQPNLGGSPVQAWQPVHISGEFLGMRIVGGLTRTSRLGLVPRDGGAVVAEAPAEKVDEEWHSTMSIQGLAPGHYALGVMRAKKHIPFHVIEIGTPPKENQ